MYYFQYIHIFRIGTRTNTHTRTMLALAVFSPRARARGFRSLARAHTTKTVHFAVRLAGRPSAPLITELT